MTSFLDCACACICNRSRPARQRFQDGRSVAPAVRRQCLSALLCLLHISCPIRPEGPRQPVSSGAASQGACLQAVLSGDRAPGKILPVPSMTRGTLPAFVIRCGITGGLSPSRPAISQGSCEDPAGRASGRVRVHKPYCCFNNLPRLRCQVTWMFVVRGPPTHLHLQRLKPTTWRETSALHSLHMNLWHNTRAVCLAVFMR